MKRFFSFLSIIFLGVSPIVLNSSPINKLPEPINGKFNIKPSNELNLEKKNEAFQFTPNPNTGKFILENLTEEPIKTIEIYSMDGRKALFDEWKSNERWHISMKNAKNGVFFIQITTENGERYNEKFILK